MRTAEASISIPRTLEAGSEGIGIELRAEQKAFVLAREQLASVRARNEDLEARLLATEDLFRTFLNNSPMASCIKGPDGQLLFCNSKYTEMFAGQPASLAETGDAAATAGMLDNTEIVRLPDGRITHWRSFRFPCRDRAGRTMQGCVAIDVTREMERAAEIAQYQTQLEAANDQLRNLVVTDDLTGMRNRRAFEERLAIEFSMARRKNRDLTIVLVDADDFKQVNDELGHPAGDAVLQQLGRVIQQTVRLTDLATRFGGEEFAIILPENDEVGALLWCGRLQRALAALQWEHSPVTVSMGIASLTPACVDGNQLVAMADQALYRAKRQGKNCFLTAAPIPIAQPV